MHELRIDRYIIDTLMPDLVGHDKRPSALLVYLFLSGQTAGTRGRKVTASLRDVADGTGLSKRGVQQALQLLERRRLVSRTKTVPTSVAVYEVLRPWRKR